MRGWQGQQQVARLCGVRYPTIYTVFDPPQPGLCWGELRGATMHNLEEPGEGIGDENYNGGGGSSCLFAP